MTGASLLATMLEAYGVNAVFGVPGETSVPLYHTISQMGGSLRHVMARDERSAGCMADVYARSSNRPGVVEFPAGAGPLYGLAAVAESNESGVPVIAITSDNPLEVEGRGFITELDCKRLFESTTKASILVTSAAKIPETIRRAFRIATTGRPGAVQITIPENVYHEDVDLRQVSLHVEEQCMSCPAYPVRGSRSEVEAVLGLLGESRRPLLIAGGGVNRSGGGEALTRFAEAFDLPVVTTMTGQQSIRISTNSRSAWQATTAFIHTHFGGWKRPTC